MKTQLPTSNRSKLCVKNHYLNKRDLSEKLKSTIERLQNDSADELKQQALQALAEDDTEKAVKLMEQSAQFRTKKAEELTGDAAWDWIDIGHIALLSDSDKALNAYEKALELAGEDKKIQAVTYSNCGIIYQARNNLNNAEEYCTKALNILKTLIIDIEEDWVNLYNILSHICLIHENRETVKNFFERALGINKIIMPSNSILPTYPCGYTVPAVNCLLPRTISHTLIFSLCLCVILFFLLAFFQNHIFSILNTFLHIVLKIYTA